MSLWKVDDKATKILMIYFFQHLKKGLNKAEALQNAKLDFLEYAAEKYNRMDSPRLLGRVYSLRRY